MSEKIKITVVALVMQPIDIVWKLWTTPEDIMNWNNASDDWYTPSAELDLRVGGKFKSVMSSRDKTMMFDFEGEYTRVEEHRRLDYVMADGREVSIRFDSENGGTKITETFDPEQTHSHEMQQSGWQAILDNFKRYAESR